MLTGWRARGANLYMEDRKSEAVPKPAAVFPRDLYDHGKLLSRERHLELLVFEMWVFIEHYVGHLTEGESLEDEERNGMIKELYKSLAHNRRPDGSKYRAL